MIRGSGDGCLLSASAGGLGFPIHPPQAAVVPPGDGKGSRNPSPEHPFGVAGWGPGLWHKAGWSCSQHRASRYRPEEMGGPGCGFCNGKIIPVIPHPRIPGAPPGSHFPDLRSWVTIWGFSQCHGVKPCPGKLIAKFAQGWGNSSEVKPRMGQEMGLLLLGFAPGSLPVSHRFPPAPERIHPGGNGRAHLTDAPAVDPQTRSKGKGLGLAAPCTHGGKTHGQGASLPGPLGRGEPGPQR